MLRWVDAMGPSVDIEALIATIDALASDAGSSRGGFLLDFGLSIHDRIERLTYSSTPSNSLTFASTGGDGVHFGILQFASDATGDGPVVMTVPMASRANHVIAESIGEFLGLGCIHGWFSLDQLAYRPEYTFELYGRDAAPTEPRIVRIFEALSLKPLALKPSRIGALARKYDSFISLAPASSQADRKPVDLDAFLAWKRAKYGR